MTKNDCQEFYFVTWVTYFVIYAGLYLKKANIENFKKGCTICTYGLFKKEV